MARKQKQRRQGECNAPRVRSHSVGEYGCPPMVPRPINVSRTHILDNTATRTLLAILRAKWPERTFSFNEAPVGFWPSVLSEFRRYYCYLPGVCDADGDAVVKLHVARTMTQVLYKERNRAQMRAERDRTSLREQCPAYYSENMWRSFCAHWRQKTFRKKSVINRQYRKKLGVVHTTGAKSFHKFKEELTQKYKKPPTPADFWDESHKKKDTNEWASEEARLIGERMREILASRGTSQESAHDWDHGISALIEAQGPIRKNRILGLPRIPANSIIPGQQQTRTHQTRPDSSSTGAGPSKPGPITKKKIPSLPRVPTDSGVPRQQQPWRTRRSELKGSNHTTSRRAGPSGFLKRTKILETPQVPAMQAELREQQACETHETRATNSSSAGPSGSGPGIPDVILTALVQRTMRAFHSDPSFDDGSNYPCQQQLHTLAQEVINGSDLSWWSSRVHEVMQSEMVGLMVDFFEDLLLYLLKMFSAYNHRHYL